MKNTIAILLIASSVVCGVHAAEPSPIKVENLSDSQRVDYLIRQNQLLAEEIQRLQVDSARPKNKEDAFAACMQAAKGQTSPMAAESIGDHCDQLLKK